jgi:hypothetical protein
VIVIGAVLTFAVSATSWHGVNLRVVGVVLILAGGVGLTLAIYARKRQRPLRLLVRPRRRGDRVAVSLHPPTYDDRPQPVYEVVPQELVPAEQYDEPPAG